MSGYSAVIIGAGNIGAFFDKPGDERVLTHAHALNNDDRFDFLGFYDVNTARADEAAKRWNVRSFTSLQEALKEAELAICAVPDAYHGEILREILKYPLKLVIAEKPLATDVAEAEILCREYEKKNIPLLVNYTRRYVEDFHLIRNRISAWGNFLGGTGYYGKGLLHNGSHMLDFIRFLLGDIKNVKKADRGIIDFYENDPSLEVSFSVAGGKFHMIPVDCRAATVFELDLFFEKKRIKMFDGCMEVEEYDVEASPVFEGYFNYRLCKKYATDYSGAFENMLNNAWQVLNKKEDIYCSGFDALEVLKICDNREGVKIIHE